MPQFIDASQLQRIQIAPPQFSALDAKTRTRAAVALGGRGVSCAFSDPVVAERFRSRYRHLKCERGDLRFVVCSDDDDYVFATRNQGFRWDGGRLHPFDVAFLADAVVTTVAFAAETDVVTFHAAALRADNSAFALVGHTHAGKSTTAIACGFAGYDLYSDEFCRVASNGVLPVPRSLSLRAGGIKMLLQSRLAPQSFRRKATALNGKGWEDAGYDELFGGVPELDPTPLQHLFWLNGFAEKPRIIEIQPYRLLPEIAPFARAGGGGALRVANLLNAVRGAKCYELLLGPIDETVAAIGRIVRE